MPHANDPAGLREADVATRLLQRLQELDSRIAELSQRPHQPGEGSSSSSSSASPRSPRPPADDLVGAPGHELDHLVDMDEDRAASAQRRRERAVHARTLSGGDIIDGRHSHVGSPRHGPQAAGLADSARPARRHHHRYEVLHHALGDELATVEMCHYAAVGEEGPLRDILDAGYSPNGRDYEGDTPLHVAAARGQLDTARVLLERGADVSLVNEEGRTPLELADAAGFQSLVELMLRFRAEAGRDTRDGETPDSYERHQQSHPQNETGASGNSFGSAASASVGGNSAIGGQSVGMQPQSLLLASSAPARNSGLAGTTKHGSLHTSGSNRSTGAGEGHVLVMVGLPARGKSFVARRMVRYWRWRGVPCEVFHFGRYRRDIYGAFDRTQGTAPMNQVEQTAKKITADAASFAIASGGIAIIDGTNTVAARRQHLRQGLLDNRIAPTRIIFVEIVRNDPHVVHGNVLRSYETEVAQRKVSDNPSSKKQFVDNYYAVVRHHQGAGRSLDVKADSDYSFIRLVNHNHLTLNRIEGVLPTRLVYFLHNLWFEPHTIYMCVTGEWNNLVRGRLGGNSELTDRGKEFADALAKYMAGEVRAKQQARREAAARATGTDTDEEDFLALMPDDQRGSADAIEAAAAAAKAKELSRGGAPLVVMSSVLSHARYTVAPLTQTPELANSVLRFLPTLDDISYGECEGQTPAEVRQTLPKTLSSIESDPYNNAWPNGESVRTLFESRLEQHIHEVHSIDRDVLIVSHPRVIQGLLYYFDESNDVTDPARALQVDVPLHSVVKLSPHGASRRLSVVPLGVPQTPGYTYTPSAPLKPTTAPASSEGTTPGRTGLSPTSPTSPCTT